MDNSTAELSSMSEIGHDEGASDCDQTSAVLEAEEDGPHDAAIGKARHCGYLSRYAWLWEIAACIFSISCIIAVVGVLLHLDGTVLDEWKLVIPPNALISFIATLAKSSCLTALAEILSQLKWQHFAQRAQPLADFDLFDAASRGPWGSLLLLIRKHRRTLLASAAAILTLTTLLFDPFMQLAIRFPSKPVLNAEMTASLLTSKAYDPQGTLLDGGKTANADYSIDFRMQLAIIQGLFAGAEDPKFTCSSGNCTYGGMSTLAICSACEDVTSKVEGTCGPSDLGAVPECRYTMPSGRELAARWEIYELPTKWVWTRWNSTAQTFFDDDYNHIMSFEAIQVPRPKDTPGNFSTPTAWNCSYSFCKHTFTNVQVVNGFPRGFNASPTELMYKDTSIVNVGMSNSKHLIKYQLKDNDETQSNSYFVNFLDVRNVAEYLVGVFSTGLYSDGAATRPLYWSNASIAHQCSGREGFMAPPISQQVAFADDLPRAISQVAASMSEFVRTGPNSTEQLGEIWVWKSSIEVRWAWLSLPLSLVILTVSVLALTIVSNKSSVALWKSSAIVAFFYRFEGWQDEESSVSTSKGLEDKAKNMKIRLDEDDGMLVVKEVL